MRAPGTVLLGVSALALAGVVAAELVSPGPAPVAAPPAPERVPVTAAAPAGAGRVGRWVGTILARPLFSPSRRPAATPAAAGPGGLPRLAGVIVGPAGKTVIFAAGGGGAPILAHEGGQVGAYRVQSIGAGEVTVRGPEGVRVLRPAFVSTDAGATAPTPPAPTRAPLGKVPSVFSTHLPFTPLPGAKAPQPNTAKPPR